MIEKRQSYITTDGTPFTSLQLAQEHEIQRLLPGDLSKDDDALGSTIANAIVKQRDVVLAILKIKPRNVRGKKVAKVPAAKGVL